VWNGTNVYQVGSTDDAINDAVANGATVINCSFSQGAPLEPTMKSALDNAQNNGVIVVCAAGNDGTNILNSDSAGWAAHPWPIIVSNIDRNDNRSPDSNYGGPISLAAPGDNIYSTITTNYTGPAPNGANAFFSGTSMAAPHVAGAAVLVRSMNPGRIKAAGTRDLLYRMAQDLGLPGRDPVYGFGMVQLPASFLLVLKNGVAFAGTNNAAWTPDGSYDLPYSNLPSAIAATPPGGIIVLNGGTTGTPPPVYPAQTLNQQVTLTAFPDRPVTIGN